MENIKTIEYLRDTFKIGYEAYETSRAEARVVYDLFHNRHYTPEQLNILATRGQPAETFNVVKMFTRIFLGYYSTITNTMVADAKGTEDIVIAKVVSDVLQYTLQDNNFVSEAEKIKASGLLSGLLCAYSTVEATDKKDDFGRPINRIVVEHVPEHELILDPESTKDDYSDARFIHRFKWVSQDVIEEQFGKSYVEQLDAYHNTTTNQDAEYDNYEHAMEVGYHKVYNKYLLIHSITKDVKGNAYSSYWSADILLMQTKVKNIASPFMYRVLKVTPSNYPEYYGVFREVIEVQKALNQALIKLQLLVSTQKAFVEKGAVKDIEEFTNSFNRVSSVIEVESISGIKIENLAREALEQYQVVDKSLDRIQRILGVNDSFLGMAYASDSGAKVKLQQNAATIALRYLTGRLETFYKLLGWDLANLAKQHYTATQVVKITDQATGERFIEINKPLELYKGQTNPDGSPEMQVEFDEVLDEKGEPEVDEEGRFKFAPLTDPDTSLHFSNLDITIKSIAYDDEDEKNRAMLEQVMNGPSGQLLMQVNPVGFFKAASLSVEGLKTKNSLDIANIFKETSDMLSGNPGQAQQAADQAQQLPGQIAQQKGG